MERSFYKGFPVSDGVGMGKICIFESEEYHLNTGLADLEEIDLQIGRLEQAVSKTLKEIGILKNELESNLEKDGDHILGVYRAILEDDFFFMQIRDMIRKQRLYAENAVDVCFNSYLEQMDGSSNEYARQRIFDLKDIRSRLIKNILGVPEPDLGKIYHKQIVAVRELTPTLAVMLGRKKVQAILADEGAAYFSHAAIILRGLGIPTLNNINFANVRKNADRFAIVDGQVGILIVNPEEPEVERYRLVVKENLKKQKEFAKRQKKPTKTVDGHRIHILANIGNMDECSLAKEKHVDGIGLVRTELLFVGFSTILDEKAQLASYMKIIKKMRKKPVTFRTVDFGRGKSLHFMPAGITPPGMDLRGIARSLKFREEFVAQIRSILNVARYGNVGICFPMVDHGGQIKEVKRMIHRVASEDAHLGEKIFRGISTGAVIETREGLENLDEILKEVDFISIGTNDLFDQLKGRDRDSCNVVGGEYLDPWFLKTVQRCIEKANRRKRQAMICGEMASDPAAAVLLAGMGLRHLSMAPSKVVEVKSVLCGIRLDEAAKLVKRVLRLGSAGEVKEAVTRWIEEQKE